MLKVVLMYFTFKIASEGGLEFSLGMWGEGGPWVVIGRVGCCVWGTCFWFMVSLGGH